MHKRLKLQSEDELSHAEDNFVSLEETKHLNRDVHAKKSHEPFPLPFTWHSASADDFRMKSYSTNVAVLKSNQSENTSPVDSTSEKLPIVTQTEVVLLSTEENKVKADSRDVGVQKSNHPGSVPFMPHLVWTDGFWKRSWSTYISVLKTITSGKTSPMDCSTSEILPIQPKPSKTQEEVLLSMNESKMEDANGDVVGERGLIPRFHQWIAARQK